MFIFIYLASIFMICLPLKLFLIIAADELFHYPLSLPNRLSKSK